MPAGQYTKMAIDFGTSNTIVTFWDEEKEDVALHHIPDVTLPFRFVQDGNSLEIPYIPSMIYYENRHTNYVGFQVIEKTLEAGQGSFRWMKAYIRARKNMKYPLRDGTTVDYFLAGRDFLDKIIAFASESGRADLSDCEVAFSVPVESFEHYTEWLSTVCLDLGIKRYRFIDESSACIFGYDAHLQPGDSFLIFDFGGGTVDVSVVRIQEQVKKGMGCRVLGKAGCQIGGRNIDAWIYAELLRQAGLHDIDARPASALFMLQVQEIKETLSIKTTVDYDITHKASGLRLKGKFQRSELEDLLDKHELYHNVQQTIDRALNRAREKGYKKEDIKEALLVGGTSQIPSIRRQVSMLFGKKTRYFRPYDAVARGACRYLTQDIEALYDHIQHDYAIKSYRTKEGTHKFIPLVPHGTRYPTRKNFKRLTMKATRDGQRFFGINIYEVAEKGSAADGIGELIFDLNGGAVFSNQQHQTGSSTEFWMNEDNPMFIEADPPAERGVPRFSVSFCVDTQKRLLVTVRDILSQKLLYRDFPVVKLK